MLGDPCEPRDPWGGSPAMGCLVPRARESGSFFFDTQDGSESNESGSPLFISLNSLLFCIATMLLAETVCTVYETVCISLPVLHIPVGLVATRGSGVSIDAVVAAPIAGSTADDPLKVNINK